MNSLQLTTCDIELLQQLKKFSVLRDEYYETGIRKPLPFAELPPLVQRIIDEIKKENGLTHVGAYAALELVYGRLKFESNFVDV